MTMTMIEKAARAHFMDGVNPPKNCPMPVWEDQPAAVKEAHRRKARAVLTAIREPNEAMVQAGMIADFYGFKSETDAAGIFTACIDSILKEGT